MVNSIHKLTKKQIESFSKPGRYNDGGGLYLHVRKGGTKTWIYRFRQDSKLKEMSLGPLTPANDLREARVKATQTRELVRTGENPIVQKRKIKNEVQEVRSKEKSFSQVLTEFFSSKDKTGYFTTEQTRRRWHFCLNTHARKLHNLSISEIKTVDVYKVLEPIWVSKTETASRTRLYIEAVMSWARTMEYREGENPAAWRGNLDQLLPPKERVSPSKNHPALAWQDIPELMARLRKMETPASFLTEFIILTAARSGEARGAVWDEIDLDGLVWAVTAERMKMRRPNMVPLTTSSLRLIENAKGLHDEIVFCNPSNSRQFSYNAPMVALRKLGYEGITVHGFRSSFKTWALEATNYPTQAVEFALAHETKNTVERAYIRGNKMLDKRRDLMKSWDDFCCGKTTL
ncbi:tyrosine-type recombinase/integrase [Hellea sp.]|nr:tyrosine-type recombinase/integrase [Hellea sp.]